MRLRALLKIIKCFTLLALCSAGVANACAVSYVDEHDLKSQSQLVISAQIVSSSTREWPSFKAFTYSARVHSVERGALENNDFEISYSMGLVHKRGDITVCPRLNGSGIEHKLKINGGYRLYLLSKENPQLLFAEALN